MDSNTYSTRSAEAPENLELAELPELAGLLGRLGPLGPPDELAGLAVVVGTLAAADLDRLSEAALTQDSLVLQRWLACLDGQWLRRLAAVGARGAAGADQDQPAPSTASWLHHRLRMAAGTARETVRTARVLFRGPLTGTAEALVGGQISVAHARVLAQGTRPLPVQVAAEAEAVLVEPAVWVDPPRLGQAVGSCCRCPIGPMPRPGVVMPGGGCGGRRPWTAWSR